MVCDIPAGDGKIVNLFLQCRGGRPEKDIKAAVVNFTENWENSLGYWKGKLYSNFQVPINAPSLRILGLVERRPPAWSPLNFSTAAVLGVKYNDLSNG